MKYNGTLDPTKMTKAQKQGYVSWANQCSKCNNSKCPDYKYYGARGIRVLYSSREFVGWWLFNLKKKKWKQPTVGRLDHDSSYCFENIEMQERRENSPERCQRHGRPVPEKTRPRRTSIFKGGRCIGTYRTMSDAAKASGYSTGQITRLISGYTKKSKSGLIFRLMDE